MHRLFKPSVVTHKVTLPQPYLQRPLSLWRPYCLLRASPSLCAPCCPPRTALHQTVLLATLATLVSPRERLRLFYFLSFCFLYSFYFLYLFLFFICTGSNLLFLFLFIYCSNLKMVESAVGIPFLLLSALARICT